MHAARFARVTKHGGHRAVQLFVHQKSDTQGAQISIPGFFGDSTDSYIDEIPENWRLAGYSLWFKSGGCYAPRFTVPVRYCSSFNCTVSGLVTYLGTPFAEKKIMRSSR